MVVFVEVVVLVLVATPALVTFVGIAIEAFKVIVTTATSADSVINIHRNGNP